MNTLGRTLTRCVIPHTFYVTKDIVALLERLKIKKEMHSDALYWNFYSTLLGIVYTFKEKLPYFTERMTILCRPGMETMRRSRNIQAYDLGIPWEFSLKITSKENTDMLVGRDVLRRG